MQHYIVTGASRGLGAAIVDTLVGPETTVYAVSRSANEELIARSAERRGSLRWFQHDLSDPTVVELLVQRIASMVDETDPSMIGVVVNAAQLHPIGQAGTLDPMEIDRAVRLNVVHPIALVQKIIAAFRDRPIPIRIVLISSGAAHRVMPGLSVYSATKAAINAFAATLQAECVALRAGRDDEATASGVGAVTTDSDDVAYPREAAEIDVYPVSPGLVDTEMQELLRNTDPEALPERDLYRSWQREGKLISPADAAQTIVTLFSRTDITPGEFIHIRDL
jgi:benzil reductase ((S)-benzoin forming)